MRHLMPAVLGLATFALMPLVGCESSNHTIVMQDSGTPYHEKEGQNWWSYQFVYHPNTQTYYEPYSSTYYWFEEGAWHAGPELPTELIPKSDIAQVVKLQADELPFVQHRSVLTWQPVRRLPMSPDLMHPQRHAMDYTPAPALASHPTD